MLHNVGNHHSSVKRHVGSIVHGQRVGVVVWLVLKIIFLLNKHYAIFFHLINVYLTTKLKSYFSQSFDDWFNVRSRCRRHTVSTPGTKKIIDPRLLRVCRSVYRYRCKSKYNHFDDFQIHMRTLLCYVTSKYTCIYKRDLPT